ncbi:HHE domain-containing protein [Ephemerocybe angulata]|uniref:HHE domain-containing protein n=1 Tax=Ephemerocybe angulata TaxID=980116 RepID=A0A8H6LVR7_9AGAR|nr:HHE domain-containing protein [Tulosesus angulatus]
MSSGISVPASQSQGQTLLAAIKQDHREIEAYWNKYQQASGDLDAQTRWANQLTWEIARHSIGEELVVYPLLEEAMGEKGHQMAEHDRADHQVVKNGLKKIESLKVGSAEFNQILSTIMSELMEHIKTEEEQDFPQLESAIGYEKSVNVAKSFERTKHFVPTRSHPSAPNKPPFETLAGLLAAPLDKLRDAFSKFPSEQEKQQATAGIHPIN